MFLPINSERAQIFNQLKTVEKIRSKLSNHINHLKEFNHIKVLFKFIEDHLNQLQTTEFSSHQVEKSVDMSLYLEANTRIKNHIGKKLQQVKQLMNDHRFEVYASLTMQCFAKIMRSLNSIEWKLMEFDRFQREGGLNENTEILIHE